jgi:hypothetical protein
MKAATLRTHARSQVVVSAMGLGCAQMGNLYRVMTRAEAFGAFDAAREAGLRYFDTAPFYGFTRSERRLGTLLTEAEDGGFEATRPYADAILTLFGPERVIWGSDWPVLTLAAAYPAWLAQCRALVPAAHHAAVFGENAVRVYRLDAAATDR